MITEIGGVKDFCAFLLNVVHHRDIGKDHSSTISKLITSIMR
jgi:hypothetical protein